MDDDGYPTEDELAKVKDWPIKSHADCAALLAFVRENWWAADWGWTEAESVETKEHEYYASTGGWSGNESMIDAMHSNSMFWMLAWKSSRRGGHYEFALDPPGVRAGSGVEGTTQGQEKADE